ncbi:MAG: glycolate oxidase subunit GlcE [Alphaproteobacteria bacterium]|nr:glycolate oxidase subunit GlcE [Alphaproteobacteria bacterium]
MTDRFRVRDASDLQEAIAWAAAESVPWEIVGRGTKRRLGRPVEAARMLDLGALSGITLYEPDELVLRAGSGTPIEDIEAALAREGQHLAFEPPDFSALFGAGGAGTLGGLVAGNLSGSRRPMAGSLRDHLLGVEAVSGRGEVFKAGGRVMKNVTGYDIPRLMAGSFGTLAVATEITLKVLPRPEATTTLMLGGIATAVALPLLRDLAASAEEPTGLAHLPQSIASEIVGLQSLGSKGDVTVVRIEGTTIGVADRLARVMARCRQHDQRTEVAELPTDAAKHVWRELGGGAPFAAESFRGWDVWRLSVVPSESPAVAARLMAQGGCALYFDWAGGLIWFGHSPRRGLHEAVRGALVAHGGGHATLFRASNDTRRQVPVFQPQPDALAALSRRIKQAFDPRGVLNPGRMYAGV